MYWTAVYVDVFLTFPVPFVYVKQNGEWTKLTALLQTV